MSMKLSHWLLCALAVLGLGVIASSATAAMPGTSTLEAEGLSITIDGAATGGLIVGATGTATITIDGTAAIVATLNSTGGIECPEDGVGRSISGVAFRD